MVDDSCDFFPVGHAQRLASDPKLVTVPGAEPRVPIDNPVAVAIAIVQFVPAPIREWPAPSGRR